VSELADYFATDWSALTLHDWIGLILTVAIFISMIALYIYVLHPRNRARLESRRHLPEERTERDDAEEKP